MDSAVPQMSLKKILFVCAGNICRSPAFEAVLKKKLHEHQLARKIHVDSCATTTFFVGEQADPRMVIAAEKHDVTIHHTAKVFEHRFFEEFDWILAVDKENLHLLQAWAENDHQKRKIHLATEFSNAYYMQEVPDPYDQPERLFDKVMEMAEDIAEGVIEILLKPHFRPDLFENAQ